VDLEKPKRRIGLFGGSFDPVHDAHLALARAALTALTLDKVIFVPAGNPWQRAPLKASGKHRLAMVQLAISGEPRFTVDDCELTREGPSYTIDTLELLAARMPDAQWMLLLGADQWARLPTWHRWQDILQHAQIAVAQRASEPLNTPPQLQNVAVQTIPMLQMVTSSTQIRARLAGGASIAGLVPQAVAQYIAKHQLYRTTDGH
jgi:nicotinate-nucleotide adenylyltransferase